MARIQHSAQKAGDELLNLRSIAPFETRRDIPEDSFHAVKPCSEDKLLSCDATSCTCVVPSRDEATAALRALVAAARARAYADQARLDAGRARAEVTPRMLDVYDGSIVVTVTGIQRIKEFGKENSQWLWPTILVPITGFWWEPREKPKSDDSVRD